MSFGSGARFGTATGKLCSASRPPGSLAVTVTDALPGATAVTVTVVSDRDAAATSGFDDVTEYVSTSSLGSLKHAATVVVSPAWTVTCGMEPQAAGGSWLSQPARASMGRMAMRLILGRLLSPQQSVSGPQSVVRRPSLTILQRVRFARAGLQLWESDSHQPVPEAARPGGPRFRSDGGDRRALRKSGVPTAGQVSPDSAGYLTRCVRKLTPSTAAIVTVDKLPQ